MQISDPRFSKRMSLLAYTQKHALCPVPDDTV